MFTPNALTVLERRYLIKDADGNPAEKPEDMFRRVAAAIAAADKEWDKNADTDAVADRFYELMISKQFMPNSPTLMNAGRDLGQLSACFVLPVGDSMEEIFGAVRDAALIHKSGGGTGFAFSRLRPAKSVVRSTGGVASGPVSFMKVFNAATEAVKQGGTRRGANMGMLRVDHPDIEEFIDCKSDLTQLTNFNISIALTDVFMKAVEDGTDYALTDPRTGEEIRRVDARTVFDTIIGHAWSTGEPGIVFLDRINKANPIPALGNIEATNPCGEQPLLPYESCNLGSVNVSRFVMMQKNKKVPLFDFQEFRRVVADAVHFLDNVITVNKYPLDRIRDTTLQGRKIGLGIMGFADLLYQMRIAYGSEASIRLARAIMKTMQDEARAESERLAAKRGTFPAWEKSIYAADKRPLRNATLTTIAPTGTISIICGTSSGIEPVFALSFIRNVMDNDELIESHPYFEKIMKEKGLWSPELMRRIAEEGTVQHIEEIPLGIRQIFVTAHDISPEQHVRMQAAFQEFTDNAVSKTINFPNEATKDDVRTAYTLAWESGLKGITIYRDGSRDSQVLNIGKVNRKDDEEPQAPSEPIVVTQGANVTVVPRPRPEVTQGITRKVQIGCGNLYVTVNYDEKGICEVFTSLGRAGGCPSQSEATSRLLSVALRAGVKPTDLIEQLRGIRCYSTKNKKNAGALSCPDAIGRVLETVLQMRGEQIAPMMQPEPKAESAAASEAKQDADPETVCPECGARLEHEGGCNICRNCGYSKCG